MRFGQVRLIRSDAVIRFAFHTGPNRTGSIEWLGSMVRSERITSTVIPEDEIFITVSASISDKLNGSSVKTMLYRFKADPIQQLDRFSVNTERPSGTFDDRWLLSLETDGVSPVLFAQSSGL